MKLSTLKLDSLRLLIPLEKVTINPNHTEFGPLQLLMMMVRYYQLKKITLID
jgi:hypothetical protein